MPNNFKRVIALFLVFLMPVLSLVSCGNTGKDTTSQPASDSTTDTAPVEEKPELLPDGTWYDGYEFNILVSGNFNNNDFKTDSSETPVNQAKYKRNSSIQEKYGIGIKYNDIIKHNSSGGNGKGYQELQKSYNTASFDYDAAMVGTYDVSTSAYAGYLSDLNSDALGYIDLTKSWWDQRANDSLMIDEKMFYTTGDISLTDNIITNCIMFNKEMIKSNESMLDPYQMVADNEWTWDNFTAEVKKVSEDTDGNDKMDHNDKFGLLTWNDAFLAAFSSARQSFARINDYNEIELTVYSQGSVAMVNKYIDLIRDSSCVYNYQVLGQSEWDKVRIAMFDNDQAAYYMTTFNTVPKHRDSDTNVGILPFPKYSADQEMYGHLVSAFHSQFLCVPFYVDNAERTSGIIEELAYEGKQLLTPAYYEQTLVGQYVRDEESIEMLDLIFASAMYDIGIYYEVGGLKNAVVAMAKTKENTFASIYSASREAAEADIKKINDTFRELLGE